MSRPARSNGDMRQGSYAGWATFLIGVPLGVGTLWFLNNGPVNTAAIKQYIEHPVEQAVVVLFFCCMSALLLKLLACMKERVTHARKLLPNWDGKPIPISDVRSLQQSLNLTWESVGDTYLGRRVANILNFVEGRGSANDLDDQLRTLADNDAMALDSSYALMRFINWSMPILGFLGTVLGITEAITGIDPDKMANDLSSITGGLSEAFNTTALALFLTMVSMFFNYLVEKLEQGLLEQVDQYVDAELAHRFVRASSGGNDQLAGVLKDHTQALAVQMQQLIETQATVWAQAGAQAHEQFATLLHRAFEASVNHFGQRLAETEKRLLERHQALLDGMTKLAVATKESGGEQRVALGRLTDSISLSVEMLTKVQTNESQLVRLQETLSQNLTLLANSQTFEQAVESLTAAIHLLTTRVQPTQAPRVLPMTPKAA